MNNENEGKRIALYVTDDILEICEQDLRKSGAKNRSRLICDAVKFYHCYLNKNLTNSVLTPAFELEPEKLELMKDRVLYKVKSINGAINLKDIIKYQNGY